MSAMDLQIHTSVGSSIDLSDFGFAGQLAHHCATLRDSWQVTGKYVATVSPLMSFKLVEAGLVISIALIPAHPET